MTGYGAAETDRDGVNYRLEIRSLNNRYLKTTIKLPDFLQLFESDLERMLRERLHRGSVTYVLYVRDTTDSTLPALNVPMIRHYVDQFRDVAGDGVSVSMDLAAVLALPGACQPTMLDDETRNRHRAVVEELTRKAVDQLIAMRAVEGQALRADLVTHCEAMRDKVTSIRLRCPSIIEDYARRLHDRVNVLLATAKLELDRDALTREVALFADRSDVSEELTRLECHLDQFVSVCDSAEYSGRKLDFLAQEMLREANTIGSKANDTEVSHAVVALKSAIDRIKEQVQNIE
jgi:uncharacterized protein (TIGR00255 family)